MIRSYLNFEPTIHPTVFVAESAIVIGRVEIGAEASIWYQSVVRGDVEAIRIGARTNLQDFVMVHARKGKYGCTVGEGVTVGHHATLHACSVGNHALVGIGAIVMDAAEVGDEALVGAGAVVPEGMKIPPRTLVLGMPARVKRELTSDEIAGLHRSAASYAELAREHMKSRAL
ncbi:MAG: gamma carbonic anhydrase family protein [Deltaproteobacteria bacterium]|nr:gamma carbonic anhydrase family protein [Deltaproteobacteria bacterium]